jgi:hypothetical protein
MSLSKWIALKEPKSRMSSPPPSLNRRNKKAAIIPDRGFSTAVA